MGNFSTNPTTHAKLKTMTPKALAANRANAKKGGRPVGAMDANKLSFKERCQRHDAEWIGVLEDIARNDPNTGFRMTAIRDLWDRGHGRPSQQIEGTGVGGAIPFTVILPAALVDDREDGQGS
jgi:hypothetical protein